jgi:hypothetical protein
LVRPPGVAVDSLSIWGWSIEVKRTVAQHWCKSVVFTNTQKSDSIKKGPLIAKQLDWEEQQFLM